MPVNCAASIFRVLSHDTACSPSHTSVADAITVVAIRHMSKNNFFIIKMFLRLIKKFCYCLICHPRPQDLG
jgi:hypothetical protein